MISVLFLLVASASLSSQRIGNFFVLPEWMPNEVSAGRTPGAPGATNMTQRITTDTLAAVNACFEAFCERSYYFSEGDIDSWTELWGPFDRTNFWFRPGPAFDYGTNRVIKTARFVETDNLIGLAGSISGPRTLESKTIVSRPSWNDGSSPETRRYWSGTAIGDLLSAQNISYDLPDYPSWTIDPLSGKTAENFEGVAASWGAFRGDDILAWESRGAESGPKKPFMRTVFDRIHFGQPPFNSDEYDEKVPPEWQSTNTVMDVASSVWGEPNGPVYEWVKTNVTFTFGSVENIENAIRNMYDRSGWNLTNESTTVSFEPQYNWYISGLGTLLYEYDLNRDFGDELDITARFRLYAFGLYSELSESLHVAAQPSVRNYRNAERNFPMSTPTMKISVWFDGSGSISSFDYSHYLMSQWTNQLSTITFECDRMVLKREITDSNNQIPALTNMTRRLFSDRCAAIGQSLSLLDCSYSRVNPTNDVTGTNFEYQATAKFVADDVEVPLVWPSGYVYEDLSSVVAVPNENVDLGQLVEVDGSREITNTLARQWSHELPMEAHLYTSPTRTATQVGMDARSEWYYQDLTVSDIANYYQGLLDPDTYAVFTLRYPSYAYGFGSVGVSYYGQVDYNGTVFYDQYLFGIGLDLPNVATVDASVMPDLSFGYASGFHNNLPSVDMKDGGVHPAYRGAQLVGGGGPKLWTIGDVFADIGNADHRVTSLQSVWYNRDHSYRSSFKTMLDSFSDFASARAIVRSNFGEFLAKFNDDESAVAGCDPWNPNKVFDTMFKAFENVSMTLLKDGTSFGINVSGFPIMTTGLEPPFVPCEVLAFRLVADNEGKVSVSSVLVDRPDGEMWEEPAFRYTALAVKVVLKSSHVSDDQQELPPYGYNIGAKLEHWTKAEWNWNALKHERNNQ